MAAFEELVGSHGGLGGTQSYPFSAASGRARAAERGTGRRRARPPPAAPLARRAGARGVPSGRNARGRARGSREPTCRHGLSWSSRNRRKRWVRASPPRPAGAAGMAFGARGLPPSARGLHGGARAWPSSAVALAVGRLLPGVTRRRAVAVAGVGNRLRAAGAGGLRDRRACASGTPPRLCAAGPSLSSRAAW